MKLKKTSKRQKARAEFERRIVEAAVRNFQAEIAANPELMELYADEFTLGLELQNRINDLMMMSKEADAMSGGWRGKLAYKLSKK